MYDFRSFMRKKKYFLFKEKRNNEFVKSYKTNWPYYNREQKDIVVYKKTKKKQVP